MIIEGSAVTNSAQASLYKAENDIISSFVGVKQENCQRFLFAMQKHFTIFSV